MTQTQFRLYADLSKARVRVRKGEVDETIQVARQFYRDDLEVDWITTRYNIIRSGVILRNARIFKEKEYIGKIEEKIGLMTHFDIYVKAVKALEIDEKENIVSQRFEIKKKGKIVGEVRPIGVYVPILSNLGKGLEGEYSNLTDDEEEALLMSIIAIGI